MITDEARLTGRVAATSEGKAQAADLLPIIEGLRAEGILSLSGTARPLMKKGILSVEGGLPWTTVQVSRLLDQVA